MTTGFSHVSAPTRYAEANGVRYAHRRFGGGTGTPLLFLQHFRGGLDHWDPAVTDGLAAHREVILLNNAGVASSTGETPDMFDTMADNAAQFVDALGLARVDVLGLSIGGAVAQELALRRPELVRRLIIAGFKPRAGEVEGTAPDMIEVATRNEVPTLGDFLYLFFEPSETSQAAGRAFWERRHRRTVDVDPLTTKETMVAQLTAMEEWAQQRGERYSELARITAPTLVVNGRRDIMIPTINSYILAQHIPNAQLVLYPDSGHGSIFQYPDLFVSQAARFLDAEHPFT
ncbi:alpha/beta fold hydrolase [Pseudofrankia asymbiotica]|uniref:Alpha/beta hydrolase n=1 Tax=Pseudofrankia asymbiotica TaxID=1834516 RepID=A0A1V2IC44_9ACTN|nr:alpha/beta hydrolase [Pseudofrankia asymbiotica]ONH29723.1 alpha/beta hydrolase [Pseudofrankia asymbiotica]